AAAFTHINVYRAKTRTGPFEKQNIEPIPLVVGHEGATTTLFVDFDVKMNDRYYYYLEGITAEGTRAKMTETAQAEAVVPRLEEDARAWRTWLDNHPRLG